MTERRQLLALTAALVLGGCSTGESEADKEAARQQRIAEFINIKNSLLVIPNKSPDLGGKWVKPEDQTIIAGYTLDLSVQTTSADGTVPQVVFTANYPGRISPDPTDPNAWAYIDVVPKPNRRGLYIATFNTQLLNLSPGDQVELGFAVFDGKKIKNNPNSTRQVYYRRAPQSPSP